MRDEVTARLEKLRGEYDAGQRMLAEMEARKLELHQTLLRISGAIQVLEELVSAATEPVAPDLAGEPVSTG